LELKRFTLFNPEIDMERPFTTSLRRVERLEAVLVKIETDNDLTGWGEAPTSPQVTGETPASAIAVLDTIIPLLLEQDPRNRESIHALMGELVTGNTASRAAIDIAVHDLLGKVWGVPLWQLFGGSRSERISTDYTVSLAEPDEMAKRATELVKEGFKTLKVKLGEEVELDRERLMAIRNAIPDEVSIRIDANQGWKRIEAGEMAELSSTLNVQFIEQPLPGEDLKGMSQLRDRSPVPIMADESLGSPADALKIAELGAADYLNIKLSKCGGFWPAMKIAAIAESAQLPCMVGGMSSTDLLATAASHFAASQDVVRFRDLDMGTDISDFVIAKGGSKLKGTDRVMSGGNGLGIEKIDEAVIGDPIEVYEV